MIGCTANGLVARRKICFEFRVSGFELFRKLRSARRCDANRNEWVILN